MMEWGRREYGVGGIEAEHISKAARETSVLNVSWDCSGDLFY